MSFYLKPPRGIVNLHTLEACVKERLTCYKFLNKQSLEVTHFQYLVEDSSLDRTGHFILRLIACCNKKFKYDFIENEVKLFETRLCSYDIQDLKLCLKRLLKHTRETLNIATNKTLLHLLAALTRILLFMLRNAYLNHIFNDCEGCSLFTIEVPFYFCLPLVAKLEVNLVKGFAEIPCYLWKKLLLSLYEIYLNHVINHMSSNENVAYALEDPRVKEIWKHVQTYNLKNGMGIQLHHEYKIDVLNIFEQAKLFPLCMLNLFKVLEKKNRLAHNDRFDLSLYLKGIGMSMSESLKFWEDMYSKEHSTCSKCTHSWQKNEKRYIYGIRHLYGFEGSRNNYQCRSCTYLQTRVLGPRDEGGCPFKQFDDVNLRNLLKSDFLINSQELEAIIQARNSEPVEACRMFLKTINNLTTCRESESNFTFMSPVDYYLQLNKKLIGREDRKSKKV
uniref:DNA primase large subunit-like n=1 Tax=Diabrotica virgifera virgifera TaxID=50390 RepID=A0A6P7GQZ8_DIAVI